MRASVRALGFPVRVCDAPRNDSQWNSNRDGTEAGVTSAPSAYCQFTTSWFSPLPPGVSSAPRL